MKHRGGRLTGKRETTRAATRRGSRAKGAGGKIEQLQELRQRRGVTQEDLAELMGVRQASISKLERRDNVTLKTLQGFVQALGGELEVRARFADETVEIELPFDPAPISR